MMLSSGFLAKVHASPAAAAAPPKLHHPPITTHEPWRGGSLGYHPFVVYTHMDAVTSVGEDQIKNAHTFAPATSKYVLSNYTAEGQILPDTEAKILQMLWTIILQVGR